MQVSRLSHHPAAFPRMLWRACVVLALLWPSAEGTPAAPESGPSLQPKAVFPEKPSVDLPQRVGPWTHPDSVLTLDETTIFDYMNGAAEIYVGYRFSHLEVCEYTAPDRDAILVELYWMSSSDDAFGLLSSDWDGDRVNLRETSSPDARVSDLTDRRALYRSGLLRLWSDDLYARVMAYRETEASKDAVLEIGKAIVAGRREPELPGLVSGLPPEVGEGHRVLADRICYLRSHFVLNSIRFLSTQNVLDLGPSVEAVLAGYGDPSGAGGPTATWLLLVRYASSAAAVAALDHFRRGYVEKAGENLEDLAASDRGLVQLEPGWTGYARSGSNLALVLDAPDTQSGRQFVDSGLEALGGKGAGDGQEAER